MKTVMFLCSGNFYRSRFAEILFNSLAHRQRLPWRAESRGFRLFDRNIGLVSPHAVSGLQARGIPLPEPMRSPLVATRQDFETFDLVIALKEAEHRPMMLANFTAWIDRVEYWNIHDVDALEPEHALVELDAQVRRLLERLRA